MNVLHGILSQVKDIRHIKFFYFVFFKMPFLIWIKIVLLSTIFWVKKTTNNILIENTVKWAKAKEKIIFITLFWLPVLPIWYIWPVFVDVYEVYLYKRESNWYEGIIYLMLAWGFSFLIMLIFSLLLKRGTWNSIGDYKICRFWRC